MHRLFSPQAIPRVRDAGRWLMTLAYLAAVPFIVGTASAQDGGDGPFRAVGDCVAAGRLSPEQCALAFRNARAEYEEKAPRYRGRADCERVHRRCVVQITGFAGFREATRGAQVHAPGFRGIRLVSGREGALSVLPVVEAGAERARFRPRPALTPDERVDGRVAVVPDSRARRSGGGSFVPRGDRDDTVRGPLSVRNPNETNESGLFVDKDGVEWYRPARRR